MISKMVIHKYRFKHRIRCVKFSPDGKHFAVCKENNGNYIDKENIHFLILYKRHI